MADIFLSYTRKDEAEFGRVRPIIEALKAEGFSVFWDQMIPVGVEYGPYARAELESAKCTLVLWSANAVQSAWVRDEAEIAKNAGCLVPVRLDETDPPLGFRQLQTADLSAWKGVAGDHPWPMLIEALRRYAPAAMPVATPVSTPVPDQMSPHLPYLRRYARALCWSQANGDREVLETIMAIAEDPFILDPSAPVRVALYRAYHRLRATLGETRPRAALLLAMVEGFEAKDVCAILEIAPAQVAKLTTAARVEGESAMRRRVLIIEDEKLIAIDLEGLIETAGHMLIGVATTAGEAVAMALATQPELIMSDVQLADGSSGLEAVGKILERMDVPVLFITAFPERLLTGARAEPAFVITKPYTEEGIVAAIQHVFAGRDVLERS